MEILNKKIDNLSPFRHGTFQLNNSEIKNDYHFISCKQQMINNHLFVTIKSNLIKHDNYFLLINGVRLMLFVSEKKEIGTPLYVHHLQRSEFNENDYEKLRSCEYILPEGGYSIRETIWNKEKNELQVSLRKK